MTQNQTIVQKCIHHNTKGILVSPIQRIAEEIDIKIPKGKNVSQLLYNYNSISITFTTSRIDFHSFLNMLY